MNLWWMWQPGAVIFFGVSGICVFFFFQAEDGIRDLTVTGVQTCALPIYRMNSGDVRQAMTLAETFSRAAAKSTDPLAAPVGDRMTGFALHFLGDQTQARRHIERMLDGPRPSVHELHIVRFQFDPWVTARSRLATILWLQGHPDQAVSTAQRGVEEAVAL